MRIKLVYTLFLLLSLNSYKSQEDNNLVLNPSFESIDGKLKKLNQINVAKDWYSPTSLKADLFSSSIPGDIGTPENIYGQEFPKEGEKLIYELLDGMRLDDASKAALEGGASDRDFKMIRDFHVKLFNSDRKKLRTAVKKHGDTLLNMVVDIQNRLKLTHADLKEEYTKAKKRKGK